MARTFYKCMWLQEKIGGYEWIDANVIVIILLNGHTWI